MNNIKMFVSIDHHLRIYVDMKISVCPCAHTVYTSVSIVALLSHALGLTGALSNLHCWPQFEIQRSSCFWTSGERSELIMRAIAWSRRSTRLHRAIFTGPLEFSFSSGKHWSLNQRAAWAAITVGRHTVRTRLIFRHPCLLLLPSVPYTPTDLKEFSFCPQAATHCCLTLKRLIRTTLVGQHLRVRTNSLKQACE